MVGKSAKVDLAIGRVAGEQHGIVTTRQLVAAGLTRAAISKRVRAGRIYRVHQGVYSVGHGNLSEESRWMAAVLACGPGAALSHGSAAVHWGLLRPLGGPVDVTVPTQNGRKRRRGIRIHRCPNIGDQSLLSTTGLQRRLPSLVTVRRRIPVTSVARTLEDLQRSALRPSLVRRAIRQAEFLEMDLGDIETDRTRSDLERDFLKLCRHHLLPPPEVNVPIGPMTVDFLWRDRKLVVETDSYVTHGGAIAFEDDRARDLALRRRGYAVHRFSERQLEREAADVAADVARALAGD
ncbi:MAG TPA: type IV toxin-antitoxin system AbiEi family antitoxin domain-containing protein [Solirubrobacterales bacterium]|nr:type IV toxin-antitoxin system AbiEi family antitoxin domain-containing protein [Solirubrobacterales bacterium]